MLNETNRALICNLKGQVSRVLSIKANILREEEISGLVGVCDAVDSLILSNREKHDVQTFQDELSLSLASLRDTRKDMIKKKVIPAIENIMAIKWEK